MVRSYNMGKKRVALGHVDADTKGRVRISIYLDLKVHSEVRELAIASATSFSRQADLLIQKALNVPK